MLTKANLMIYQGDDYEGTVTVSDGVTPPAQVIAGYTAQAQIRQGPADSNPTIIVQIQAAVNSPYITLTIPVPARLPVGQYTLKLWVRDETEPPGGQSVVPRVARSSLPFRVVDRASRAGPD